jgi:hypothetical protein
MGTGPSTCKFTLHSLGSGLWALGSGLWALDSGAADGFNGLGRGKDSGATAHEGGSGLRSTCMPVQREILTGHQMSRLRFLHLPSTCIMYHVSYRKMRFSMNRHHVSLIALIRSLGPLTGETT